MNVMIGVDPHKGSHTATMLDRDERELRRIKVRSTSTDPVLSSKRFGRARRGGSPA